MASLLLRTTSSSIGHRRCIPRGPGECRRRRSAVWLNRATATARLGDSDGAIQDFRALLAECPDFDDALYNLGTLLSQLGRLEEAESVFSELIALHPRDSGAFNNRGNTRSRQGRLEDGLADYVAATEITPSYALAHHNAACALRKLGRESEAAKSFERAHALGFRGVTPSVNWMKSSD